MGKLKTFIMLVLFLVPIQLSAETLGFLAGSGGLGDDSFNDATYRGMALAAKECGCKLVYREWEQERDMDLLFMELVNEKADQIVLNGNQFHPLIEKYAHKYPKLKIISNDFNGGNYLNVKSIVYGQHEGAFLAGALAGWFTRSGKIGFIGAIDIDVIDAFRVGFEEGVAYASSKSEVKVDFISKLPDYSGFNNPEKASQIAKKQYASGVDVIFAVAGLSGNGVIRTARMEEKFVIGVDRDQDHMAKGFVLTSVMKRLDVAVHTELLKINNGDFKPGKVVYSLVNGGISLSPMKYTKDKIPAWVLDKLKHTRQNIVSGVWIRGSKISDNI